MTQRISAHDLAEQRGGDRVTVIDVGEPMEFASGPLVFVCQSGNRGAKGVQTLLERGQANPITDLEGGLPGWQQAGLLPAFPSSCPSCWEVPSAHWWASSSPPI